MGTDRIFTFVKKLVQATERDALSDLKAHIKNVSIKKRVLLGIYKTRAGALFKAFNLWKNAPKASDYKKHADANSFEKLFEKLIYMRKKQSFDSLKDIWYHAEEIKKQCLKKMLYISGNKKKIYFDHWAHNIRNLRHIEACKNTISLFESMREALNVQMRPVISDSTKDRLMLEALTKMANSINEKKLRAFNTWKSVADNMKWKEELQRNEVGRGLDKIQTALEKAEAANMREVLDRISSLSAEKFKMLRALGKIKKTVFNLKHNAFSKWKALPPIKQMKKEKSATMLSLLLNRLVNRALKDAYEPLKEDYLDSKELQRRYCYKMIMIAEGK